MVKQVADQKVEVAQSSLLLNLNVIIVSESNKVYRRRHRMTREALQELIDSIKQVGVVQAITVRPDPLVAGQFIIVSGERRYRASKFAGKTEIPAYIREVSEEVAEIMQITENIQRENVHELEEAEGYALILERDPSMTTAELARRCGKSETYVLQRLKLNDLVKEARKDFSQDLMSLGHAIIIARLTKDDQKQIVEQYVERKNGYGTVSELQQYIDHNIVNSLSSAAFDKKDATLYPKAGACVTCPHRSGASPLLFSDIKQKDKCFNRECFFHKCGLHLVRKTREVIETQTEVVFLSGYGKVNEEVNKILTEYKITPLREYDDFSTSPTKGKEVEGLWISGDDAGKVEKVFIKKDVKEITEDSPQMKIVSIQHRIERGKELDEEKVYAKIIEAFTAHPSQKKTFSKKMFADEEVMLWYIIYDKASYRINDELTRFLGINKETPEKIYTALKNLKPEEKAFILRRVIMDQYADNLPRSSHGFIVKKIAAAYGDIDIAGFEKEQGEICTKREVRARERIKDLQAVLPKQKSKKEKSKNRKGA
jgi:ParB/RepB/Spo0J family partition protein